MNGKELHVGDGKNVYPLDGPRRLALRSGCRRRLSSDKRSYQVNWAIRPISAPETIPDHLRESPSMTRHTFRSFGHHGDLGNRAVPYGIRIRRRISYVHLYRGGGTLLYGTTPLLWRGAHEKETRSAGIVSAFPRSPGNACGVRVPWEQRGSESCVLYAFFARNVRVI